MLIALLSASLCIVCNFTVTFTDIERCLGHMNSKASEQSENFMYK